MKIIMLLVVLLGSMLVGGTQIVRPVCAQQGTCCCYVYGGQCCGDCQWGGRPPWTCPCIR